MAKVKKDNSTIQGMELPSHAGGGDAKGAPNQTRALRRMPFQSARKFTRPLVGQGGRGGLGTRMAGRAVRVRPLLGPGDFLAWRDPVRRREDTLVLIN